MYLFSTGTLAQSRSVPHHRPTSISVCYPIQWNLRKWDTLGLIVLSLVESSSLSQRVPYRRFNCIPPCPLDTLPLSLPPSLSLSLTLSPTQGYWPGSGWLVTGSPSRSSVTQFWRTVVNKRCSIVIEFSPQNEVQSTGMLSTNLCVVHMRSHNPQNATH